MTTPALAAGADASLGGRQVVHVIGSLAAGGAERFVVDLVCELRRRGLELTLLALSRRRDAVGEAMAAALARSGVRVWSGPTERVRYRTVLAYARALRRLRPDLVHLHNVNAEAAHYLVRRFLGFPYAGVRTVHSSRLDDSLLVRRGFAANPIGATIFCSGAARESNGSRFCGLVRTIENGVRFDWPVRTPELAHEAKRELGLDPDRLHFLCVGRIMGRKLAEAPKAHDTLVAAWRRTGLGEGALLHVVGDGNLRPALEALAGGDPTIAFHGVRSDVRRWLLAADCFVMPSRWEGLPIAAVEALGTGLPCIFSRIPALEDLRPARAHWCEPSDVASLARALVEFARAPGYPPASAVQEERRRFSIESTASAYLETYARLLGSTDRSV